MNYSPTLARALLHTSADVTFPATEIMWHLRAAWGHSGTISETTVRSHVAQARRYTETILAKISAVEIELDRAARSSATVIPIGDGDAPYQRTLSAVNHEMGVAQ